MATERAYHHFAPASTRGLTGYPATAGGPVTADEFDESDVWGSFTPGEEAAHPARSGGALPRVRAVPGARPGRKPKPVDRAGGGGAAHGSLPVAIPDWSKILGGEYQGHQAGDWELDDADDEEEASGALATRRRLDPGGEALNPHLAEAGKTGDEFSGASAVDGGEARRR